MKQSERGRAVLLQAEALDPRSVRTQVALAGIAAEAKNHTEAIRRYARIMEIDPAHELPYLFLPALLIEIKNFRLAEEILAVGEKWVGHQPSYHINRGVVYQALGKHHLALGCFDKAFTLNPKDRNAVLNQGVSFLELGFVEEAEKKFEQCINDEALRVMAYKGLADIAFRKKDLAQAGHYLEQALLADPEDDESKLRLGIVKIQEGDFSKSAHWIHQITQDQQLSEKDRERLYFCRKALGNRSTNTQTDKGEHHDHLNH